MNDIRKQLLSAGVKNLQEFGYPSCNESNILSDYIFKTFFARMLRDNLGKGYDAEIKSLLKECEQNK